MMYLGQSFDIEKHIAACSGGASDAFKSLLEEMRDLEISAFAEIAARGEVLLKIERHYDEQRKTLEVRYFSVKR